MKSEQFSNISTSIEGIQNRNLTVDDSKPKEEFITYEEYINKQKNIILGAENYKKTWAAIGHPPSDNELGQYFVDSGQAEKFSNKYSGKVIPRKAS